MAHIPVENSEWYYDGEFICPPGVTKERITYYMEMQVQDGSWIDMWASSSEDNCMGSFTGIPKLNFRIRREIITTKECAFVHFKDLVFD